MFKVWNDLAYLCQIVNYDEKVLKQTTQVTNKTCLRMTLRGKVTWLDLTWLDLTWLDLSWLDLTWLDLTWLDLTWLDLTWLDLTWLDLTWLDLTWLDLTWLDLTWLDLKMPTCKFLESKFNIGWVPYNLAPNTSCQRTTGPKHSRPKARQASLTH